MPGKIKINFKMPPETAAEKMYRKHQELRKKSGLPDPDHYKKLAAQKQKEIEDLRKEEAEQLDEMPESSMKTRDVHSHLKKAGWSVARTGGGHDIYSHPQAKRIIAVPRHKQLKAPLIKGILKASKLHEETEIEEQLQKKGRFVSGPPRKTFKAPTIVSPIREAKDAREYDYEGDMAISQLRSLIFNAEDLIDMMDDNTNLPEWVQSKITLAEDYISTAANYLRGELTEEVKVGQKVHLGLKQKGASGMRGTVHKVEGDTVHVKVGSGIFGDRIVKGSIKNVTKEEVEIDEAANPAQQAAIAINMKKKGIKPKGMREEVKDEYARKVAKYLKKKYNKEEVELTEGRPSQRHPLEGHEYHKKSDEALVHIAKDAHAAAEAMKGHNTAAENKYRDQANDSATVRYFRKKSGMPDWYKKKYGHVKEEIEYLEEKNAPTNPALWSKAKALARSKFDVYPSAYANGWASKWYKSKGGGWRTVSEETEEPSAAARTLSRKAQIVKDAAKSKKVEQEEASDKFQKDPELSSDIHKT